MSTRKIETIPSRFETISAPSTLINLLRQRSLSQPDRLAYTYLSDGQAGETSISYTDLDRQARILGATLQSLSMSGERALLLYPPGLDFIAGFFGCLYAGTVAVPAYPPSPQRLARSLPRLRAIIADAQATLVLTTSSILSMVPQLLAYYPDLKNLRWLASDALSETSEDGWREPEIDGDKLAFLQYTSGSTGAPRGVMLTHNNLLHNASLVYRLLEHTPEDRYVSWLPVFHDMGFMAGVLEPLYAGIPVVLMSPSAFLRNPVRWLQAISRYKGSTSGGPNFAYDLCVRKITDEECAALDLSSWSAAFNGAEPIREATLEAFSRKFEPCGFKRETFYPCYGLAEATLIVSGGSKAERPISKRFSKQDLEKDRVVEAIGSLKYNEAIVGCGKSLFDQSLLIADPQTGAQCGPDEVGEIWVSGPSVAQGYWNRQEETERIFHAKAPDAGQREYLRTGDLGFIRDGQLYVTGRLKDLVIIRGRNHYPQDLELTAEKAHTALRQGCGAAFSVEAGGQERLVIAQEVDQRKVTNLQLVADSIRQAVAEEHELQAYAIVLIKAGSIPKTSSGKIQRHACRRDFLQGTLEEVNRSILEYSDAEAVEQEITRDAIIAASAEDRPGMLQSFLRQEFARVLKVPGSMIDMNQALLSLGIDSLNAVEMRNRLESALGITLPVARFLNGQSLRHLASTILEEMNVTHYSPVSVSGAEPGFIEHPLSPIQQSLWFLYQLMPDSSAYNVSFAARIDSAVNVAALKRAFQVLVDRHPSLRTTYTTRDGQPVQRVHKQQNVNFDLVNLVDQSWEDLKEHATRQAHRPFDIEHESVLRVNLFSRSAQEHLLLITAHHIAIDGWSLWILLDELRMVYEAQQAGAIARLMPLPAEYTDFVGWQEEMLAGPQGARLWDYWKNELAGELPVLNLPTARRRPAVQTYLGASHQFELSEELTARLKAAAKAEQTTLYMILLAAFQVLLHRYTAQDDILVGSPMSARSRAEFEGIVGCFFNPVVIRANLSGDPTFRTFLSKIREKVYGALDHQEFPSLLITERLQPLRDTSRSPLFQATFILQRSHRLEDLFSAASTAIADSRGLALKFFMLERRNARADLELEVIETGGPMVACLQYNSDILNADTAAQMAAHFRTLLEGILADPNCAVSRLPLLTEQERQTLIFEWSNLGKTFSESALIDQLFQRQAEKTPDKVAAFYNEATWTFKDLNDRSDLLANLLKELV